MGDISIRRMEDSELEGCARVIRDSFATLAESLNITRENCPTSPSFITSGELRRMRADGSVLFGLFEADRQLGFVAAKNCGDGVFYLEKLSVLPECSHKGFGGKLIDFVFDYAGANGGSLIKIRTVEENTVLKKWYLDYGFVQTEVRHLEHLPFAVCLMEMPIPPGD